MSSRNSDSRGNSNSSKRVWTVVCAVVTVVLGPAAVTASALDQANKAPMYHAVKAEPAQAYLPSDLSRRRAAA
ncbi:membrane protein [Streptomyces viridochromogenes]|uniref:Membrane protein n=1 Tax=Streptomyces viridochromogenes TaxID=1938 RepID=A0A0J7YUB3_STRVR|nr:hypothetical protein [Streptomyces viridochromogenes]KMS67002.1 membrane protein [Streptomyces viridochromogenes]KOG06753.1 membrane protein [Streptomyces viridochromogenes]KOG06841.1 membrane protein [Streptomyces viridochromogenes]